MKKVIRTTQVVSVSLPQSTYRQLEKTRKSQGQSRSSFINHLIKREAEEDRWKRIYKKGQDTALKFNIASENDIDRLLHEA